MIDTGVTDEYSQKLC